MNEKPSEEINVMINAEQGIYLEVCSSAVLSREQHLVRAITEYAQAVAEIRERRYINMRERDMLRVFESLIERRQAKFRAPDMRQELSRL